MRNVRIRKSTMTLLLIFVFFEVICLAVFNLNWIQCAPCETDSDCAPCFSRVQYYCMGVGTFGAFIALVIYSYIYFKNRSLHL